MINSPWGLPEPDGLNLVAAGVQELMGGKFGEMSTVMNYRFQSFDFRAILRAQSGPDFDRAYLKQFRSRGLSEAERNDGQVQSKAADATLKPSSPTALPLIKTHLQVSRDEMKDLG